MEFQDSIYIFDEALLPDSLSGISISAMIGGAFVARTLCYYI